LEKERRIKKLSRDEDTLKLNIEIVNELLEPEEEEDDILMLRLISFRPSNGKIEGQETPRVTINFGEVSHTGLCDLNSTINILPYYVFEGLSYYLDNLELEHIDTTIMLADRTIHECKGILHNVVVFIGSFVYPH
jgi:hypothetical protein